ncbi:MAG: DNA-binding NtrC family response regulator [Myxococcota bacterium]|jgi:DNA-binding NtrC family response regulator
MNVHETHSADVLTGTAARILVVDTDSETRSAAAAALRLCVATVVETDSVSSAIELVSDSAKDAFDLVLSDLHVTVADGQLLQRAVHERDPHTSFVLMSADASVEKVVDAMRTGAFDFIQKPLDLSQLEFRVLRALDHRRLVKEVHQLRNRHQGPLDDFVVANSPSMAAAVSTAKQVAAIRSTVLITGETGTGKEVIAGLIHTYSAQAKGPFIKINCAALPETLLESELFGHEQGAFTGADRQRIGLFERAVDGTLLLDEIAETSPATQAKLLRVLQDQEFYRLGGNEPQRTNARIVAATNRDLGEALRDGSLREDLYYRINVIQIHLEPLRERREDIDGLADLYLEQFARDLGRTCVGFTAAARARMASYAWPGNVRELRNAIERSVLLCDETLIDAAGIHLQQADGTLGDHSEWRIDMPAGGLSLQTVERALVLAALRRTGFVQKDAAQLIGVSKRKLNYMIQRMGLVHENWRRNRSGLRGEGALTSESER